MSANRLGTLTSTNLFVSLVHAIFLNSRSPWVFLKHITRSNASYRVLRFAVICVMVYQGFFNLAILNCLISSCRLMSTSECKRQRKRVNKLLIIIKVILCDAVVVGLRSLIVKVISLLGPDNLRAMGKT